MKFHDRRISPGSVPKVSRGTSALLAYALASLALSPFCPAQELPKETFKVAMRDGVKLATDVYFPSTNGTYPVLLARTPYNKSTSSAAGREGARHGYVTVIQDTRGRFASEGDNLPFEADGWATCWDGQDTVRWILSQSWCNGRIGSFGGSAGAITQMLLAGAGATNVISQHLVVGAPSLYSDVVYPGGIFRKSLVEDWLRISAFSPEALKLWVSHPNHDGYWRTRELTDRYDKVNSAAVHLGGYFDIFAQGTIDAFLGYQEHGGPGARGRQKLIMGPWTHSVLNEKAGELVFPNAKRPPGVAHDQWLWFESTLKEVENGVASQPPVTYYVMGDVSDPEAPGNKWRTAACWPPLPARPTPFYLGADRSIRRDKPGAAASLHYDYAPTNPVPTIGGPQLTIPAGPRDQRSIEGRPDVLVFSSESLSEPVEVIGRVRARLWISSDAADTDFFVRLCDVYPDGRSFNICEGGIRARFRESFAAEKLLEPGEVYPVDVDMWSTSIIFQKGHRLRVQVTSSSAPGFDPNPNTGEAFRSSSATRVARNTVYCDSNRPSHVLLPVVNNQR